MMAQMDHDFEFGRQRRQARSVHLRFDHFDGHGRITWVHSDRFGLNDPPELTRAQLFP